MNVEILELARIEAKLDRLLSAKIHEKPIPEWSSLRMAWELKQGCAYETMRTRRRLQPMGGRYDAYLGGVGVFSRETIVEWLTITDGDLDAYHLKHETGCASAPVTKSGRRAPRLRHAGSVAKASGGAE